MKQIIEDLIELRKHHFKSQRAFEKASGLSREIVRKTELGERSPSLEDLVKWLEACNVDPVLYLTQFLSANARKILASDPDLDRQLRSAIRNPEKRRLIESLLKAWRADDGVSDARNHR